MLSEEEDATISLLMADMLRWNLKFQLVRKFINYMLMQQIQIQKCNAIIYHRLQESRKNN